MSGPMTGGVNGEGGALSGKCLCGAVTITVTKAPTAEVGVCHCRMCQRWSGSAFFGLTVPASHVEVTGEPADYTSFSSAKRAFCPQCGTHLWFRDEEGEYELSAGLFEDAVRYPLTREMFVERAMTSCRLPGEHQRQTGHQYKAHKTAEGDAS